MGPHASTRSSEQADRILDLLVRILRDRGLASLNQQAKSLGIPLSTAYRFATRLRAARLIARAGRGCFSASVELTALITGSVLHRLIAENSRPHLQRLARRLRLTVHMGVIEDDMVTYLVKLHGGGPNLLTRAGTQLEAYCSAIGKVLLAALPKSELERYLRSGPLVALTPNTITKPAELKRELATIRTRGFAVDAQEVLENMRCVAVPVCDRRGNVVVALSASRLLEGTGSHVEGRILKDEARILAQLRRCKRQIEAEL